DELDVEIGKDQLFLDRFPDDPRHLVAVELDDGIGDFDLRHGAKGLRVGRRTKLRRRSAGRRAARGRAAGQPGGVLMTRPERSCKRARALQNGGRQEARETLRRAGDAELGAAEPGAGTDKPEHWTRPGGPVPLAVGP